MLNKAITQQIGPLNEFIAQDIVQRKKFIRQHGSGITESFIPQLDCRPEPLKFQKNF